MSRSPPRPLAARLVIALFVLASLAWVLHTPSDPQHLYRALPSQVSTITRHRDLPARLPGILANPGVDAMLFDLGLDPDGVRRLAARDDVGRALRHLAGREVVTGVIGDEPEIAWYAVSQIGWRGLPLRWLLSLVQVGPIEELERFQGYHVWRVDRGGAGPTVVFTIHQGMLIASGGPDPVGLHRSLSALDGRLPSAHSTGVMEAMPRAPPDAAWFQLTRRGRVRAVGPSSLVLAFTELDARRWAGWVETPDDQLPALQPAAGPDPVVLRRLFGGHPLAFALAPPEVFTSVLPDLGVPALPPAWERLLASFSGRSAGVAVLSGPHSGRLSGVRVPAVVAAVPLADREDLDLARGIIDQVREAEDWAVTPRADRVHDRPVLVLDPTSMDRYATEIDPDHRIAFAEVDGHLVVSTSLQALGLLLAAHATADPTPPDPPSWADVYDADAAVGALWMDSETLGQRLAPLLTLYSMGQATGGVPGGRRVGAGVQWTQHVLALLEPMGEARARLDFPDRRARLTFRTGAGE